MVHLCDKIFPSLINTMAGGKIGNFFILNGKKERSFFLIGRIYYYARK